MIIRTRNSVYRLVQDGAQAVLTKIEDKYSGRRPAVKVGDQFKGVNPERPALGKSFYLGDDFVSSAVTDIEPEAGDDLLHFGKSNMTVSEDQFKSLLHDVLGLSWNRALAVFRNYGTLLSWDVANVLLHAADKGKTDTVLATLEDHYTTHLQFQHPDIRGSVKDKVTGNPTEQMLLGICQDLGLKSAA